jgi:hypothetical protein
MAASLAIESPVEIARVVHQGTTIFKFGEPTAWNEAEIWLLALACSAIVVAAGLVGMYLRRGVYLACLAGIAVPIAVTWRVDEWARNHTHRFPYGVDLIRDQINGFTNTSNVLLASEWEQSAKETALQLGWVALGLAAAAAVVAAFLELRRRRRRVGEGAATGPVPHDVLVAAEAESELEAGRSGEPRL